MLTALTQGLLADQDIGALARTRSDLWARWLTPIRVDAPTGDDPGYDDNFQRMREEVNKLSGADTTLVCQLAQTLLTTACKDVRVATYYLWARTYQDGDVGLADGLALLSGLVAQYGETMLPARASSRKAALEWLAGSKLQDALARHPEVVKADFTHAVASLSWLQEAFSGWDESSRPSFSSLTSTLETRLARAGGADAVVPQQAGGHREGSALHSAPALHAIASGRDLLDQSRALASYLRNQPQGGLAGARLMRVIRWDTVNELPPQDDKGNTRLVPPKGDMRGQLKRLYLQQNWQALLEQVEEMFAVGVNHFWLDLQWYACQALRHAGRPHDVWEELFKQDLRLLLLRLPGLEQHSYNDGTPFADEATRAWIDQFINDRTEHWSSLAPTVTSAESNDILALESEALAQVDSHGIEAALTWLSQLPGIHTTRQRWLQRLLMARVAEQSGKNEMALHLLGELDAPPASWSLLQWEPELCFEIKARRLQLLRLKAQRNDADKAALARQMEPLLAGLVAIDPARAAVLCG